MLQLNRCNALLKGHIAIGSAEGAVQPDRKGKGFFCISGSTGNSLFDGKTTISVVGAAVSASAASLRIGKYRRSSLILTNIADCAGGCCRIAILICFTFRYFIADSGRKSGCDLILIVLQRKRCSTICERHTAVGSVDRIVTECYSKCEIFIGITCIACDNLGNDQVTSVILRFTAVILCVGKSNGCGLILSNDSVCTGSYCRVAILICFTFRYFIADICRKSGCSLFLIVLQRKRCSTVCELHITVGSVNRIVTECYSKCELFIGITRIACDNLEYGQTSCFLIRCRCRWNLIRYGRLFEVFRNTLLTVGVNRMQRSPIVGV